MNLREGWRLLRVKDYMPHTLFHGYHGSKWLETDKLLRAEERRVCNPGGRLGLGGPHMFMSGWHFLDDEEECAEYLERFKDISDIVVCRVMVGNTRPKPRANSNVKLARYMKINAFDWVGTLRGSGHL